MIAALSLSAIAVGLGLGISAASAMTAYRWKYRPVVVFASNAGDAALAEQRRIFAASRAGLLERDVVVVWVVGNTVKSELGPGPGANAAQLRARFDAQAAEFRVILVGKDGGAKLSQSKPLAAAALFGTIDAMPMRLDEMKSRR